jgi:monoterpene epsilon-lactone hydrolase
MTDNPPAVISDEAKAWLTDPANTDNVSLEGLDFAALRAEMREFSRDKSQAAIERHRLTVTTTSIGGVDCLDVRPANVLPDRTILYHFGGGFTLGSPEEYLPINGFLAEHCQARVICPNYRLAPEHPFPAAIDDVTNVAKALWSTLAKPPMIAGESAGGTLSLSLCHQLNSLGLAMPSHMALMSPAADMSVHGDSLDFNAGRDPSLNPERIRQVRAMYSDGEPLSIPLLSPFFGEFGPEFPKTLISSGTRDLLLSYCVRLARVMRDAGIARELRLWEGMWHVFEWYPEIPEAHASLSEFSSFLNEGFAQQEPNQTVSMPAV